MALTGTQMPADRVPAAEVGAHAARLPSRLVVVPCDRAQSQSHRVWAPRSWQAAGARATFSGRAQPGEFYVFQVGVVSSVPVSRLRVDMERTPGIAIRCINSGGVGPDGKPFEKHIALPANTVQVLWFGIDVPDTAAGSFAGKIAIRGSGKPAEVDWRLAVGGPILADHGDDDASRLARLRWLDSTIGQGDAVVRPYSPISVRGMSLKTLGRAFHIKSDGLPSQIASYYTAGIRIGNKPTNLLQRPMSLSAVLAGKPLAWSKPRFKWVQGTGAQAEWESRFGTAGLQVAVRGHLGFDGFLRYDIDVQAGEDTELEDFRLNAPYARESATYICGLGVEGRTRIADLHWKWDVKRHQDALWLGGMSSGAAWRFKGGNYRRPLVNIYYSLGPLTDPDSWDNEGRGGVDVVSQSGCVLLSAFSGPCLLQKGKNVRFTVEIVPTPVKPIDTDEHWATRYIHPNNGDLEAVLKNVAPGGYNTVNIHQAAEINPFINYPYSAEAFPSLVDFTKRAHDKGLNVKVYYTTRELTQNLPELDALYSLNGEVIHPGPGAETRTLIHPNGPHPWLKEHFDGDYIPAWVDEIGGKFKGRLDLAVITTPESRWNNFYLEGLDYLARKAKIDGVYIDDSALDRLSLLRARRVLENRRPKPMIDLHSWNHFNEWAGYACNILLYAELLPYIDRIWFGEGFDYNRAPDYWLVEISGLPFGLMGEMLQGGGNPWRGMLYGMTTRLPWSGDPRPVWKAWDDFGMKGTEMLGYWDPACPVKTGRADVLATVYRKKGKTLIALASWAPGPVDVRLQIDWKALGMEPSELVAPGVAGFQEARTFVPAEPIPVQPGKGWMLVVQEQPT